MKKSIVMKIAVTLMSLIIILSVPFSVYAQTTNDNSTLSETDLVVPTIIPEEDIIDQEEQSQPVSEQVNSNVKEQEIILSLYNVLHSKEITVTVKNGEFEEKIEFTRKNDYFVTVKLPVGNYEIVKIKSNDKLIKVDFDVKKFSVGTSEMQNASFEVSEKEPNIFIRLLANNWFFIVALIALFIALHCYNKKKLG